MLLSREHLPLSSVDLASPHGEFPQSRFFESRIKVLDLESRVATVPSVLIARSDAKGAAYAVERQDDGLYVVCKLGSWVDLHSLAEKATVLLRQRLDALRPSLQDHETSAALTTPHLHKSEKKKRAAIEAIQSLVRKRARSQSVSNFEDDTRHDGLTGSQVDILRHDMQSPLLVQSPEASAAHAKVHGEEPVVQSTAASIFENIRMQYFEALYKSKVSTTFSI
jgi:DNA replication regulator SLD3